MKKEIKNYNIYEKEGQIFITINQDELINFPFENANVYISKKNISNRTFFVSTTNQKNVLKFIDIEEDFIDRIKNQKVLLIGEVTKENELGRLFEFDVKNIK